MILAGASLNQTPLDWANNMANILEAINQAKTAKAEVLCLPELTITGYGCEDMFLHRWVADKALEQLGLMIPQTTNIAVTVGLPMWFNDQLYNVACFIANGEILGFQAKQNLPKDGCIMNQGGSSLGPPIKLKILTPHSAYCLLEIEFTPIMELRLVLKSARMLGLLIDQRVGLLSMT